MIYHNTPLASTSKSPCRCCNRDRPNHDYPCPMQLEESSELQLNNNPEWINTYLPMITTLARMSCVRALSTKDGFLLKSKLSVQSQEVTKIETPKGITYRRTQKHLKPFQLYQKVQTKEQHKEQCQKRTLSQLDFMQVLLCPKRQIKMPIKLNL